MKAMMSRFLTALLVSALLLCNTSFVTPSFAAGGKTDPYVYAFEDDISSITYVQFYRYLPEETAYTITDYVTVKGNQLTDKSGKVISTIVRPMTTDKPTVGFTATGELVFITTSGKLIKLNSSTSAVYQMATEVSNVTALVCDSDDIVSKVGTKPIANLTFSTTYLRGDCIVDTSKPTPDTSKQSCVKTYVKTDTMSVVHDVYHNDVLLLSTICRNSNVWSVTRQQLLSDTCIGAKFVGYSRNFDTILSDLDGTVYCFPYHDFSKALPISLGEEIMSVSKDECGFITAITTSRKTYDLTTLLSTANHITWVKNTTQKTTSFDNTDTKVDTLEKVDNYLFWNGTKLENSYSATYFGISRLGYPVWINSVGELRYYNGIANQLIVAKATLLRYNESGFAHQYKVNAKIYDLAF